MLPLGRKNSRKCSECDITCHANCAHLVPDFCGMSMETANIILSNWRDINKARGSKAGTSGRTQGQAQISQYQHSPTSSAEIPITQSMQQMKLTGMDTPDVMGRQQSPSMEGRPPDTRPQQSPQTYSPQTAPLGTRPGRVPPNYDQPLIPQPGRTSTSSYDQPSPGAPQYQVFSNPGCFSIIILITLKHRSHLITRSYLIKDFLPSQTQDLLLFNSAQRPKMLRLFLLQRTSYRLLCDKLRARERLD